MSKVNIYNCRFSYERIQPHGSTIFLLNPDDDDDDGGGGFEVRKFCDAYMYVVLEV